MLSLSNPLAQNASHQLNKNQQALNQSIERLSSGLRVNSAKDDAAGQAIGNRMTSQIRGGEQSVRNANDGISMLQTAEGALDEINERLQRVRDLTVQGLSDPNTGRPGDAIQAEINLNLKEIDRLNREASYNGISLLDGSAGTKALQVGADDGDALSVDLNPPGFAVRELGLERMTVQGTPGDVSGVDTLGASARRIPLDAENTTLTYSPPEGGPNLVRTTNLGVGDLVQLGGEGGRLQNSSVFARHDTDTLENSVNVSVSDPVVKSTWSQRIDFSERLYQNAEGEVLAGNHRGVVQSGGEYWIETSRGGALEYRRAELAHESGDNRLTVRAVDDAVMSAEEMENPVSNPISYMAGVTRTPDNYELTLDGADESANDNLQLVRLGGRYFIEENEGGNYSYYQADVTVTARETSRDEGRIAVTSSRSATQPQVADEPFVRGFSTVHFKPDNNNVTVNYRDTNGQLYRDVMESDGEGGYRFRLGEFEDGEGAYKTARIVRDDNNDLLLQTVNGDAEVVLYHPLSETSDFGYTTRHYSLSTDVESNSTTVTIEQSSEIQRLRNPARPLEAIDEAIGRVDDKRSELGALNNRLDSVIDHQESANTNLKAARSRIMDADFATEVSNRSKANILQQAGTSVLAQANQNGESVLSLLG